ncbi:MAG: hypothetical protein P8170_04285 [Gemmatimonadota bacterium]
MPWTLRWGPQRTDLVRFNRVEALSVGARGQVRLGSPLGPLSLTAISRLGTADREANVRLSVAGESLRRRISWSVFHELAGVDETARPLRIGNSVTALFMGRDDGEYYRRSGTALEWTPPSSRRRTFRVRGYAEHHRSVETGTRFSIGHLADEGWTFRDNLVAGEGWELGTLVELAPWWGTDPRKPQGGLMFGAQGGTGDTEYVRAYGGGVLAFSFARDLGLRLEVAGGRAWGKPTPQRLWILGGPTTLRGYGPRILEGRAFSRARGELGRDFAFGPLMLFADAGWAGNPSSGRLADALVSVGAGLSLVEGLVRVDAAWGLRAPRGFRLELYLDGVR